MNVFFNFYTNLFLFIFVFNYINNLIPPLGGSFFSNVPFFNQTNITNYTIQMAFVLTRPDAKRSPLLQMGTFNKSLTFSSDNTDTTGVAGTVYTDQFYQNWVLLEEQLTNSAIRSAANLAKLITNFYSVKNPLVTLNNTLEINFVTPTSTNFNLYSAQLIIGLYSKLNATQKLSTILLEAGDFFTYFNQSQYNQAGYWPLTAVTSGDYIAKKWGFDIIELCPKAINWYHYGATQAALLDTYNKTYHVIIDHFISIYSNTTSFYLPKGNKYIDFSAHNLRTNMSLGFFMMKAFYTDYVEYAARSPLPDYLPDGYTMEEMNEMQRFLVYEYLLYSDLHCSLEATPFFDFMFQEFNVKMEYLNKVNVNIPLSTIKRKMVWFAGYDHSLAAIYKMLNYDWEVKKNKEYISLQSSWNFTLLQTKNVNSYFNFPFPSYGFTVSFELISTFDNVQNIYIFYILMRENFSDSPVFILSIADFSNLSQLFMMSPQFSADERDFYC